MAKIAVEREEHLKKGKIAQEILRVLNERPMNVLSYKGTTMSTAFLPCLEQYGIGRRRKNSSRVAINRLRRQRFIEYGAAGERNTVQLTSAGKRRILQYDFERLRLDSSLRWDGVWRLVMFDIPEAQKRARDAVSKKLNQLGFYQLQRSVLVHYMACREEIEFIQSFFMLGGLITYIEAHSLGFHEEKLRRFFRIRE